MMAESGARTVFLLLESKTKKRKGITDVCGLISALLSVCLSGQMQDCNQSVPAQQSAFSPLTAVIKQTSVTLLRGNLKLLLGIMEFHEVQYLQSFPRSYFYVQAKRH